MKGQLEIKELGILAQNLITSAGMEAIANGIAFNQAPGFAYIAVGLGTTAPGSSQTALVQEIYREQVNAGWCPNPGTVRLVAVFGPTVANGDWREFGIFDSEARRVTVSTCEGTAGWSSDGTLTQETTNVQQGEASLRAQMTSSGTIAFSSTSLSVSPGTVTIGTADYLQFWYYTTHDIGTLTVEFGQSPSSRFRWTWAPGTTNAWACFHQQFASASVKPSNYASWTLSSSDSYFRITHSAQGTVFDEYLDWISCFGTAGNMLARGTISATKQHGHVYNLYYSLKMVAE